jgi:hypothetical protein
MAGFHRGFPVAGDLELTDDGRDLVLASDREKVLQNLKTRFGIFKGSWRYDRNAGIPYFDDILVHSPRLEVVRRYFYDTIMGTPGVSSVLKLDLRIDRTTGTLYVDFACSASGDIIADSFDFVTN